MPKKSELMTSIVFCKMHPSIGKVLGNMTLMKCPCVSRFNGTPFTQISPYRGLNPCFFYQLSHGSQFGGLTWFHTALDQL